MSSDTIFLRENKDKVMYDLRSEVNNHLAPNVTLFSNDNVMVKGHSNVLVSCPYFRELFEKDITYKTTNLHLMFVEDFSKDVLELVVKYIYTGEYSLLDSEKLPEVLRATSEEKYNIPELEKDYLIEQFDAPGGLTEANWHLFYKSGIKLSMDEEYFNRIFAFLVENHPEFYKSEEFIGLTFNQICKIMVSPNRPFASIATIMEAILIWTREHTEVGMDKLADLSKICTNLFQFQNGNPNPPAANSAILDASVQSANGSFSTQVCPQPTILSDPHCSSTTRKRTRSISPQINPNERSKRSNVVEVYQPPKYSWDSAQLLFFGKTEASEPGYLWSYSFQTGEIKKMAKMPIEDLEFSSLLVSQDWIYSIGGNVEDQAQDFVQSFPIRDLENLDRTWDDGPKLLTASRIASTILFQNVIYIFAGDSGVYFYYDNEKWDIDSNGICENSNRDMLYYDRNCYGATLFDNVIYIIGGYEERELDFGEALDTGESFNIGDGTLALLPTMRQARFALRVVTLKDRIYAIGGFYDNYECLTSVESYKPGDSSWKQVASMNHPRAYGSAFVLDDMIYVVGGNVGAPTMERYCPQEDRWTMVDVNLPEWADLTSSALLGKSYKL